jgi:hypothetical protein
MRLCLNPTIEYFKEAIEQSMVATLYYYGKVSLSFGSG